MLILARDQYGSFAYRAELICSIKEELGSKMLGEDKDVDFILEKRNPFAVEKGTTSIPLSSDEENVK